MRKAFSKIAKDVVTLEQVEANPHLKHNLICVFCGIAVTFVKSFPRSSGGKTTIVRATFKRGKNKEHKECPFNAKLQMTILARDSDNNIFNSLKNDQFEFRLNMIHHEINKISDSFTPPRQSPTDQLKKQNYISTGKLSSYLSTMNKIIELRNFLADDYEDLTSIVRIKYNDKVINWSKFYYDRMSYRDAFESLANKKIPLCIEGKVHSIQPTKFNYAINLQQGIAIKKDGITQIPKVTIYFKESLKDKLELNVGDHIAVSALYKTKENIWKKGINFLNINGELYNTSQLHVFKESH